MMYIAKARREDGGFVITFPDAPGCVTECDKAEEIVLVATEALEGWLEAHLATGQLPTRPVAKKTSEAYEIEVSALLSLKLELLWARSEAGLTQAQLAKKIGVSQQRIAALEDPDQEVKISTAQVVLGALGRSLRLGSAPATFVKRAARAKTASRRAETV